MLNDILFPKVLQENWQMMPWEKIALTGVLARIRPKGAIEVGVYYGGSLSLTAPFCEKIIAIDVDPAVNGRFEKPRNADIWIAPSHNAIPRALRYFEEIEMPINYVLIDADHSAEGVQRDIDLILDYLPKQPMFILMHDSGNANTRSGIMSADWARNPHLHFVDLDFVPGQIIEHSVSESRAEIWGGLAIAYLDQRVRVGPPLVQQSAKTSIECLHHYVANLFQAS